MVTLYIYIYVYRYEFPNAGSSSRLFFSPAFLNTVLGSPPMVGVPQRFASLVTGSRLARVTCSSLGVPPPFFPGILLSRKLPETQGKRLRG